MPDNKIKTDSNCSSFSVNWYPGHMTKARREMEKDIKIIDLVVELLDARVPLSSRNPDIDTLAKNKYRAVLLNKADLADPGTTKEWIRYFENNGIRAIAIDARVNQKKQALKLMLDAAAEKLEKDRKKGILNRPVRTMVAGIPNVGKSTFINSFAGKSTLKTGNKPGVTKNNQWMKLDRQIELLDTPGILWPKFEDMNTGLNLALIGSINDDILDKEELCYELIKKLSVSDPELFAAHYGIDNAEDPNDMILSVALKRNMMKKGGEADREKAASAVIDEFRAGKLGKISLEHPAQFLN